METKPQEFCPYKGLEPYEEADQRYFFGRERDSEIIISNLCATPLTVLYGASGVGKSSVLLAGVAPKLRNEPGSALIVFRDWQISNFLETLKQKTLVVISAINPEASRDIDINLPFDKFLRKCARASRCRLLLIFDQFEEYFLYHRASQNGHGDDFDSQFARAVNRSDLNANFLLSLRDDGLSKLDRFQARIPNLLRNLLRLEHLDHESAQSAICEPLLLYNREHSVNPPATISGGESYVRGKSQVRSGLVARLLEDLKPGKVKFGEAGFGELGGRTSAGIETPFLQMVLMRLWAERSPATNRLDEATYDRLGGAQDIVRTHLDNVMRDKFADDETREIAARLFQYLVTPENEKIALSQAVLAAWIREPVERVEPVINLLSSSDVRILRPVNVMLSQRAPQRYEIFHDVLAPAILGWRTRFIVEAETKKAAELRIEEERKAAEALVEEQKRQVQLERDRAEAERQQAEHQRELAAAEARERKAQEERAKTETLRAEEHEKTSKRLGRVSKALAAMFLVAILASVMAVVNWRKAVANERSAIERRVEAEKSAKEAEKSAKEAEAQATIAAANETLAENYARESERLRDEGNAAKATAQRMTLLAQQRLTQANRAAAIAAEATAQAEKDRGYADEAIAKAAEEQRKASILQIEAETAREEVFQAEQLSSVYQSALIKYRSKDYQGAINLLTEALPLMKNGSADKAYALTMIGHSLNDLNKETEAVRSYNQALEIFRANKDGGGEADTLKNLGDAYRSMKGGANRQEAVRYYENAIAAYENIGARGMTVPIIVALGDTYAQTADPLDPPSDQDVQKAEGLYRQVVKIYNEQKNTKKAIETLSKIARLYEYSDDPTKRNKAYEAYGEAAKTYRDANQEKEAASVFNRLAVLQGRHGNTSLAQKNYENAARAFERSGDLTAAARTLSFVASTYDCPTCDTAKKRTAAEFYQQTVALFDRIKPLSVTDRRYLISSLKNLITIYKALGEKKLVEEYKEMLEKLEDPE